MLHPIMSDNMAREAQVAHRAEAERTRALRRPRRRLGGRPRLTPADVSAAIVASARMRAQG
jgi:hypothetical protein